VKRSWLLYLVIFSLALNLGTIGTLVYLYYAPPPEGPPVAGQPPLPMRELWQTLNLTPEQRQTLRALLPEHRRRVMGLRRELAQQRRELFDLIKGESPSLSDIQAKTREISARQGALEEEIVRFLLEFKRHLKPEQHAAFVDLVQTRLARVMGGMGKGHGPRGGPPPGRGMGMGLGPAGPPGPGEGPQ
jgi:Spy/CpxP family protein refolding chaperone